MILANQRIAGPLIFTGGGSCWVFYSDLVLVILTNNIEFLCHAGVLKLFKLREDMDEKDGN